MKWHYSVQGGHTHVRVFLNGAKCGDLCFRNEEFGELLKLASPEPLFEAIPEKSLNERIPPVSTETYESAKPQSRPKEIKP